MKAEILLIEDDQALAASFERVLKSEGYSVTSANRGDEGLRLAQVRSPELVITDLRLPGLGGLEIVSELHKLKPKLPIILITAHGTTQTAIDATKLGACEYLRKPFQVEDLLELVAQAVQRARLMSEPVQVGEAGTGGHSLIGQSRPMQNLYKEIGRVAGTSVTVLIRGESGTGKELVARALYQNSQRAEKPFIAVNCGAIPETLLESELFGHERGAFTGALARRVGRFEQAHGGTLFLDEIGDLAGSTQVKLLRVLQEKSFRRVGGEEVVNVDVRVLTATHRDLEAALETKDFREDLYYRLNVVTLRVPPLREHVEDIPDLVRYFIQRYAHELAVENPSIRPEAVEFLKAQTWPGNVRQLENIIRQALLLAGPFAIGPDHLRQALARAAVPPRELRQAHTEYIAGLLARAQTGEIADVYDRMLSDLEPELFTQALKLAQGNQTKVAHWLGWGRLRLREKLVELGFHSPAQRG
jgi:nitrogen regulation protein NR(I)